MIPAAPAWADRRSAEWEVRPAGGWSRCWERQVGEVQGEPSSVAVLVAREDVMSVAPPEVWSELPGIDICGAETVHLTPESARDLARTLEAAADLVSSIVTFGLEAAGPSNDDGALLRDLCHGIAAAPTWEAVNRLTAEALRRANEAIRRGESAEALSLVAAVGAARERRASELDAETSR